MTGDWKDMLGALASQMPYAPEETPGNTVPETETAERKPNGGATLRVLLDKKGRKGKMATIIEGFEMTDEEVDEIASLLKKKIGTGGSSRGGEILLQGDWRDKACQLLKEMKFNCKKI